MEQVETIAPKGGGRRGSFTMSSNTDKEKQNKKNFGDKDQKAEGVGNDEAKKMLAEMGIGVCCKKGLKPESPNQDSFTIIVAEEGFKLLGVYDGHGPQGHDVSQYAKEAIVKLFLEYVQGGQAPSDAFTQAFENTQRCLESITEVDSQASGSTCTFVYVPKDEGKIVIAHVGDSRAVLASKSGGKWKAEELTEDHKPNLPGEKARIEKAGGRVVFDGYFNYRVFTRDGRGGLNMSRALGDCIAHKAGVSASPEIKIKEIPKTPSEDLFILICSDGVWEFIENQEAVDLVTKSHGKKSETQNGAELLAKDAYNRWLEDSEGEVADDITVIYAYLP